MVRLRAHCVRATLTMTTVVIPSVGSALCHPERSAGGAESGTAESCGSAPNEMLAAFSRGLPLQRPRRTCAVSMVRLRAHCVRATLTMTTVVIPSVRSALCHPERSERSERSRGTAESCGSAPNENVGRVLARPSVTTPATHVRCVDGSTSRSLRSRYAHHDKTISAALEMTIARYARDDNRSLARDDKKSV